MSALPPEADILDRFEKDLLKTRSGRKFAGQFSRINFTLEDWKRKPRHSVGGQGRGFVLETGPVPVFIVPSDAHYTDQGNQNFIMRGI